MHSIFLSLPLSNVLPEGNSTVSGPVPTRWTPAHWLQACHQKGTSGDATHTTDHSVYLATNSTSSWVQSAYFHGDQILYPVHIPRHNSRPMKKTLRSRCDKYQHFCPVGKSFHKRTKAAWPRKGKVMKLWSLFSVNTDTWHTMAQPGKAPAWFRGTGGGG